MTLILISIISGHIKDQEYEHTAHFLSPTSSNGSKYFKSNSSQGALQEKTASSIFNTITKTDI